MDLKKLELDFMEFFLLLEDKEKKQIDYVIKNFYSNKDFCKLLFTDNKNIDIDLKQFWDGLNMYEDMQQFYNIKQEFKVVEKIIKKAIKINGYNQTYQTIRFLYNVIYDEELFENIESFFEVIQDYKQEFKRQNGLLPEGESLENKEDLEIKDTPKENYLSR